MPDSENFLDTERKKKKKKKAVLLARKIFEAIIFGIIAKNTCATLLLFPAHVPKNHPCNYGLRLRCSERRSIVRSKPSRRSRTQSEIGPQTVIEGAPWPQIKPLTKKIERN